LLFGWSFSNYHASAYKTGNPLLKISPGKLWNENLHKSVFTFKELSQLLANHFGFETVYSDGFSYGNKQSTGSDSSFGGIRNFINRLMPKSLREGIVIIAKKK